MAMDRLTSLSAKFRDARLGVVVFLTKTDGTSARVSRTRKTIRWAMSCRQVYHWRNTDIVASNSTTAALELLRGNGDGTFQPPISIALPGIANAWL